MSKRPRAFRELVRQTAKSGEDKPNCGTGVSLQVFVKPFFNIWRVRLFLSAAEKRAAETAVTVLSSRLSSTEAYEVWSARNVPVWM